MRRKCRRIQTQNRWLEGTGWQRYPRQRTKLGCQQQSAGSYSVYRTGALFGQKPEQSRPNRQQPQYR